jgi:PDGLE domain-containing protein
MRRFTIIVLAVAVGLATAASPFASSSPDGLERVAEDEGFLDRGRLGPVQDRAPVPDYAAPGISDERIATGAAGFAGTLLVFVLGTGTATLVRRLRGVMA